MLLTRYWVGDVPVVAESFGAAVRRLLHAPRDTTTLAVHFVTAHSVAEAAANSRVARAYQSADLNYPDGAPIAFLGRRQGFSSQRICGPDMLPALVDGGRSLARRHFFLGGAPGVAETLADALTRRYPGTMVAGCYSPPFRELTSAEDATLCELVNATEPDYVWVGLGTPKQDLFVHIHRSLIQARALLAVGAAFDFHSGRQSFPPRWMQRSGTAWLYRLSREPRRLWRRYTVSNARFIVVVAAQLLGVRPPPGRSRPI